MTATFKIMELQAVAADSIDGEIVGYLADGHHDTALFACCCRAEHGTIVHPENVKHIYYLKNPVDPELTDNEEAWEMTVVEPQIQGAIAATWVGAFSKLAPPCDENEIDDNDPDERTN